MKTKIGGIFRTLKHNAGKAALGLAVIAPAAAHAEDVDIVEKLTGAVTTGSTVATSIVVAMVGLFVYKVVSKFIRRGLGSV